MRIVVVMVAMAYKCNCRCCEGKKYVSYSTIKRHASDYGVMETQDISDDSQGMLSKYY